MTAEQPEQNLPKSPAPVLWLDRHAHPESRTRRYLSFIQAIAAVLSVGGLLALVLQLREANVVAKRESYYQAIDTTTQLTLLEMQYPGIACALYPEGGSDFAAMDQAHQDALQFLILSTNAHERFWRQHRDGILADEDWAAQDRWFRNGIVATAMFPAVWDSNRDYHEAGFRAYVDDLVAQDLAARATATVAAVGTPDVPTLADFAAPGHATPSC